jgi:hypothetical protein
MGGTTMTLLIKSVLLMIIIFFLAPALLSTDSESDPKEIVISKTDIDTAYKIVELITVMSVLAPADKEMIRDSAKDYDIDAAIFVNSWRFRANFIPEGFDSVDIKDIPKFFFTDAILVKYLTSEEIKKRNKKAKKPPKLKIQESPLDPVPTIVKDGGVKFSYKIIGILNLEDRFFLNPSSAKKVNSILSEKGFERGADGVIHVDYMGKKPYFNGAKGIMIKFLDKWPDKNGDVKTEE